MKKIIFLLAFAFTFSNAMAQMTWMTAYKVDPVKMKDAKSAIGKKTKKYNSKADGELIYTYEIVAGDRANYLVRSGFAESMRKVSKKVICKKDIVDNTQGLEIINKIRVFNFKYSTAEEIDAPELQEYDLKNIAVPNTKLQIGAIAQEIEEVIPDTVTYSDWGVRDINTDPLVWHLVNAVKELSAENNALKARLDAAGL